MSLLFGIKGKNKKNMAVVDFSSSSVAVGFVDFNAKLPLVLWNKRFSHVFLEKPTGERLFSVGSKALKELAEEMFKYKDMSNPGQVVLFLSSFYCSSKVRTIKVIKDKQIEISKKIIENLIDKEIQEMMGESEKNPLVIIEKKVMGMKLNGYEVSNPYGKKASEIEIPLFISYARKDVLEKTKKVIGETFHCDYPVFHTSGFALYEVLKTSMPEVDNFSLLNIAEEVTDVLTIHDGKISTFATFPLGHRTIVRGIAEKMELTPMQAKTIIELYAKEGVHYKIKERTSKIIDEAKTEWCSNLEITMGTRSVPKLLFISGDYLISTIIHRWLAEGQGLSGALNRQLKTKVLDKKFMANLYKKKPGSTVDTFIAMESVFTKKII